MGLIVGATAVYTLPSGDTITVHVGPAVVNVAPTADAGADQDIRAGQLVNLDGSASFDDDTTELVYAWSFGSQPGGSTATLVNANTATPSFTADVAGTYVVQLQVTDEGELSDTDEVMVSSDNLAPTAAAGADRLVIVGNSTQLDGLASSDPESDTLTYAWSIDSAPAGSTASLSTPEVVQTWLTPDLQGEYVVKLTVSDPIGAGTPATVTITATTAQGYAENRIMCGANLAAALGPNQVTTKGNQIAFGNFLSQAVQAIQKDQKATAISKLNMAIERADGCEANPGPDGNGPGRDWITDCGAQSQILVCLRDALQVLAP